MNNPYVVLGLSHDADADAIRARYLELVREHPPERSPQRFGEIREAYDSLRDPVVHLEQRLFDVTASQSFDNLVAQTRPDIRRQRIATNVLMSLARS